MVSATQSKGQPSREVGSAESGQSPCCFGQQHYGPRSSAGFPGFPGITYARVERSAIRAWCWLCPPFSLVTARPHARSYALFTGYGHRNRRAAFRCRQPTGKKSKFASALESANNAHAKYWSRQTRTCSAQRAEPGWAAACSPEDAAEQGLW